MMSKGLVCDMPVCEYGGLGAFTTWLACGGWFGIDWLRVPGRGSYFPCPLACLCLWLQQTRPASASFH